MMRSTWIAGARCLARPFALGLGIGVGLAVCGGAMQADPDRAHFETVRAKRFTVVDRDNEPVAFFGIGYDGNDNPKLVLLNSEKQGVVILNVLDDVPGFIVRGKGEAGIVLSVSPKDNRPYGIMYAEDGRTLGAIPGTR